MIGGIVLELGPVKVKIGSKCHRNYDEHFEEKFESCTDLSHKVCLCTSFFRKE